MPELPDITIYLEHLHSRLVGRKLLKIRIKSPFLVRTVDPPIASAESKTVIAFRRIGKQIVVELEDDLFIVIHLMIAGRLYWRPSGAKIGSKVNLAAFDFPEGTLVLTEASTKKRASLHLVRGIDSVALLDRGGIDVLSATARQFRDALLRENHTLKRALTDPRIFSGIGNAYSDEILHAARLSPLQYSIKLSPEDHERLFDATQRILRSWIDLLRAQTGNAFPEKVTAFHPEMAVHGKFRKSCPDCATPIQRIRYAENECNYCPTCQTNGKLLKDRSLSKLLREDWPKTIEELESRFPKNEKTVIGRGS